jgi:hypothetical protein
LCCRAARPAAPRPRRSAATRRRLDFPVSSRGWAYLAEEFAALDKGEFDACERLIVECRKGGLLPLDVCAEDGARAADNLEGIDEETPEEEAAWIVDSVSRRHLYYTPLSFWEGQDDYVEMAVEKVDLKSLFTGECARFCIPLTNARGWNDLNSRAAMMRRFAHWEAKGKRPVLLYCGDFDHGLSTGNPRTPNLEDPRHPDHSRPYVQDYLRQYGPRKVEANALVTRPKAGRELCRQAILRYLPENAPEAYEARLAPEREKVRRAVIRLLAEGRTP